MTTRTLSASNAAAAAGAAPTLIVFVNLDFTTGTVAAHSGLGTFAFGGDTYLGVGQFGAFDEIKESANGKPLAARLSLSGLDADLVADLQLRTQYGRDCSFYLGFVGDDGALVDTPELLWAGYIDSPSIVIDVGSATITLTCESQLSRMRRGGLALATTENQQLEHAGDTFFDQLPGIAEKKVEWLGRDVRPSPGVHPFDTSSPGTDGGGRQRP